ncbi:MAG: helix-turn-helix transcriptional regulator [Elusimicrobiota bacterium]
MLSKRLGQNIRAERLRKQLTQEQLGEFADIHYTFVGHIERGTKLPSLVVLDRIARALEIPSCKLLGGLRGETPDCLKGSSERTRRSLP